MTFEQILKAVSKYELTISSQGVTPKREDTSAYAPIEEQALAHALWMCGEIRGLLKQEGNGPKAERWLCFIQGVLWLCGLGSIDGFRKDNAPK